MRIKRHRNPDFLLVAAASIVALLAAGWLMRPDAFRNDLRGKRSAWSDEEMKYVMLQVSRQTGRQSSYIAQVDGDEDGGDTSLPPSPTPTPVPDSDAPSQKPSVGGGTLIPEPAVAKTPRASVCNAFFPIKLSASFASKRLAFNIAGPRRLPSGEWRGEFHAPFLSSSGSDPAGNLYTLRLGQSGWAEPEAVELGRPSAGVEAFSADGDAIVVYGSFGESSGAKGIALLRAGQNGVFDRTDDTEEIVFADVAEPTPLYFPRERTRSDAFRLLSAANGWVAFALQLSDDDPAHRILMAGRFNEKGKFEFSSPSFSPSFPEIRGEITQVEIAENGVIGFVARTRRSDQREEAAAYLMEPGDDKRFGTRDDKTVRIAGDRERSVRSFYFRERFAAFSTYSISGPPGDRGETYDIGPDRRLNTGDEHRAFLTQLTPGSAPVVMEQFRVAGYTDNRREGSSGGRASAVRVSFIEVPYPGAPMLRVSEPGDQWFGNGNEVELSAPFEERSMRSLFAENMGLVAGAGGVSRIQWCY